MTADEEYESLEAAALEISAKYTIAQMTVRALRERWQEIHERREECRRRRARMPEMAEAIKITHFAEVSDEDIRQSDLRLEVDVCNITPPHYRNLAALEDMGHAEV